MDTEQMRNEIAKAYPGKKWKDKVKKMGKEQVFAVHQDFKKRELKKAIEKREKELVEAIFEQAHQMTMAEVFPSTMRTFKK